MRQIVRKGVQKNLEMVRALLWTGFSLLFVGIMIGPRAGVLAANPPALDKDSENREYCRRGIEMLMDGDPDTAINIFRQIEQNDPQSPLGYLLDAEAVWWKIYYSTANLLDPDVFDVALRDASPYDSHFSDLINVAITRSEARIRAKEDVARSTLYQGMAYALDARLSGLRGRDLASTRAGKKMRTLLLSALKLDPSLTDGYLGLGIYNYLIDTLPSAMKVLKILVNVPGGNRKLGMQQIQQAAEKGDLVRGEAKFYLAKNLSRDSERKYKQSLEIFQGLANEYPHNPLWTLLSADMLFRLGETREGDVLYREGFTKTENMSSESALAVHLAARDVLARLHPNEKLN